MDAEEARKALDLARKHDANGSTESALKWARKSIAIYSTPEAVALFARLKEKGAEGRPEAAAGRAASSTVTTEEVYTSTRKTSTDASGQKKYTEKQVEIVRRVKRAGGDFYAVLEITKSADEAEVKKAYKKVR